MVSVQLHVCTEMYIATSTCDFHLLSCFQDVESYDPILNPVLNREVRRTGGRVLITLGDQDIDLSPSFTIFLSTRDPSVRAITFPILRVACR